jgi:hypothetical protein
MALVSHQSLVLEWQEGRGDSNSVARKSHTHNINHVTLTAQRTLSVASDTVSCVNMAKSLHHIDVTVHGLTTPEQWVAMMHRILEACTVDCFFHPCLLFFKFYIIFQHALHYKMG